MGGDSNVSDAAERDDDGVDRGAYRFEYDAGGYETLEIILPAWETGSPEVLEACEVSSVDASRRVMKFVESSLSSTGSVTTSEDLSCQSYGEPAVSASPESK